MAKDILKEAIADAKAVREVALANAKAALEEAFTPKLQSMLSAKLSEELDENKEDIEETYMEDEKDDVKETYMEDEKDSMEEVNLDEEIDLEEILNELELEEAEDSKEKSVDEAKDEDLDEAKKDEDKDDVKEAKDEDLDEAKIDEEEKLDEVRPHYRAEEANDTQYKAEYVNEDSEFDLDSLLEEINNLDEEKEETNEEVTEEPVKEDFEETNEVVGTAAAGMAALFAAAGGLAKVQMAMENPETKAKYPKLAKLLDVLGGIGSAASSAKLRENEMEEAALNDETLAKIEDEIEKMFESTEIPVEVVQAELEETKKALETVRGELNEVNLLNSKLLYVNRIFKANQLDEAQKLRVVESLDKAGSAKEAKLIYETIKDTFNISKNVKTSSKKSIKEGLGMASKAVGTSTAPKKEVISESNDMIARFQKLANIKINE